MPEAVTELLAETLAALRPEDMPRDVLEATRRSVLDWLGSALAGSLEPPARMAQAVAAGFGASDEATVFGSGRASAAAAAFANGVASHILEMDDVHKGSTLHGAAPIIPAALAVAEREHTGGRAFLLAVAAGYEAALRIGEAVNPSHYRFWHPTGTAGTFGAAASAAKLLRLDAAGMRDAGEMNDLIDTLEIRLPIEGLRQIRMLHHLDAGGEGRLRRPPHGGADCAVGLCECGHHRTADESGSAGDQDARHASFISAAGPIHPASARAGNKPANHSHRSAPRSDHR